MKKVSKTAFIFGFALFPFMSIQVSGCWRNSNNQNHINPIEVNYNSIIDKDIEKHLLDHIYNSLKHSNADTNSTFVIIFTHRDVFYDTITKDSIIYISTLNCDDINYYDAYRGVLNVSNFFVAIFDNTIFGQSLYNKNKIIDRPFTSLKCKDSNMRLTKSFKYHNNKLIECL